jgi:hypothetical protein
MKPLPRTYQLAHAAGIDAGNRSMRRAGRKKWNDRDYAAAIKEFERIWPLRASAKKQERDWRGHHGQ